jgi:hypothetical protein
MGSRRIFLCGAASSNMLVGRCNESRVALAIEDGWMPAQNSGKRKKRRRITGLTEFENALLALCLWMVLKKIVCVVCK